MHEEEKKLDIEEEEEFKTTDDMIQENARLYQKISLL